MTTLKLEGGEERMEVEEKREEEEKREKEKEEKAMEGRISPAQLRHLMGDVLNTLGRPLHPHVKTKLRTYCSLLSFLVWGIRVQLMLF